MTALKIVKPEVDAGLVELLGRIPLFAEIKERPDALATFSQFTSIATFRAGDTIINQGERGDCMYVLAEGQAAVYRNTADGEGFKVVILNGADLPFFGEGALLDDDARTASIKADSDCRCIVLTRQAFDEFGRSFAELALPIMRRVSQVVLRRMAKQGADLVLLYNALVGQIRGS